MPSHGHTQQPIEHTAASPQLEPSFVTIRCVFGCPSAVVESSDPWAAHEAMEAHYTDAHAAEIAAATAGGAA